MLFRCLNAKCTTDPAGRLMADFEGDAPVCPKCGADARNLRYANLVIPLSVIHFDPPDLIMAGKGMGYPACRPDKTLAGIKATGVPGVVNCKACKETDAFKAVERELKAWDQGDYEVEVDLAKGVIVPKG